MENLGLHLKTIWGDNDLLEFRIVASNSSFLGTTECYVSLDEAAQFAECISGFPSSRSDVRVYEFGSSSELGGARILFRCRDGSGHLVVEARIWTSRSDAEAQEATLVLRTVPAEIDKFVEELLKMKTRIGAEAHLRHAT